MSKKRSPIWQYFLCTTEDSRVVNCKVCGDQVSRGGSSTKTFNTTNMVYHLKKHKEFAAYSPMLQKERTLLLQHQVILSLHYYNWQRDQKDWT